MSATLHPPAPCAPQQISQLRCGGFLVHLGGDAFLVWRPSREDARALLLEQNLPATNGQEATR